MLKASSSFGCIHRASSILTLEPTSTTHIEKNDKNMSAETTKLSLLNSTTASAVAGLTTRLLTHPMDTIKTNLQANPSHNIWNSLRVQQLYRGVGVACLFQTPAVMLYLSTYDLNKEWISHTTGLSDESSAVHLASGVIAEVVSGALWTPMEIVKQRLQVSSLSNATELFKQIWQQEGFKGFYRGYSLTLAVFVPYSMMYFVTYERLKLTTSSILHVPIRELPFWSFVLCSAVAGGIAGAFANPLDIVKTRWQIQPKFDESSWQSKTNKYSSPLHIIKTIWKEEGLLGFTRGMGARVLWVAPSVALSMSIYEEFKRVLSRSSHNL